MKWEKPKHWIRQKKTKAVIASTALVFALLAAQPDIAVADMYVRDHEIRKISQPVCSIICLPAGMGLIKPTSAAASIITSIQDFSISVSSSSSTGNATITSVTTTRAHCVWGGSTNASTSSAAGGIQFYIQLTSSTNVQCTRGSSPATAAAVVGSVIEYTSAAISNIQQGTIALTASSNTATATITSVTTTNSACFFLGQAALATGTLADWAFTTDLTAATTVTATRSSSSTDDETIGYVVVSFASGILNSSTQAFSTTMTAASSNTATVSAVTLAQTMTAWGGFWCSAAVNESPIRMPYGQLTSTTVFTATRTSSSQNVTYKGTLIEFKSSDINGVDRGTAVIASSATTQDVTIGSVVAALTATLTTGFTCSADAGSTNSYYGYVARTSTTNLRATRNTSSGSLSCTVGYEVVEFK